MKSLNMKAWGSLLAGLMMVPVLYAGNGARIDPVEVRKIMVLDFQTDGFVDNHDLGIYIADELTRALFIRNQYKVVDRAQVRAITGRIRVNTDFMDREIVRDLGRQAEADFLILGKAVRIDDEKYANEAEDIKKMQISFRILSTTSGSVVGMISENVRKKGELKAIAARLIWKMAGHVKF